MGKKRDNIIEKIKVELIMAFLIVDIGSINFYIGPKIEQNQKKKIIKLF